MPNELEESGTPADDSQNEEQPNDKPQPKPAEPTIEPTGDAELDAKIAAAVTAALNQQREAAEQEARKKAAAENGNFRELYEQSQQDLHRLELNQWRGQALKAAGLADKWFDSIQGDTLEAMTAFAKQFKKQLDDEIKNAERQITDEHPGTPRGAGKDGKHRDKTQLTGAARVSRDMKAAFGVHRLPSA